MSLNKYATFPKSVLVYLGHFLLEDFEVLLWQFKLKCSWSMYTSGGEKYLLLMAALSPPWSRTDRPVALGKLASWLLE